MSVPQKTCSSSHHAKKLVVRVVDIVISRRKNGEITSVPGICEPDSCNEGDSYENAKEGLQAVLSIRDGQPIKA